MSLLDAFANTIEERLAPSVERHYVDFDNFYPQFVESTSGGVVRSGIARENSTNDWVFIKVFEASRVSGAYGYRSVDPGDLSFGDNNDNFTVFKATRTHQGLSEMTAPQWDRRTVKLHEGFGNFTFPLEMQRASQFPSAVEDMIDLLIQQAARRPALGRINAFWALGPNGEIGTFTSLSSSEDITSSGVTVTLATGRPRMLAEGQTVDIYEGATISAATRMTSDTNPAIIDRLDPVRKTLTLKAATTINLTASTTYTICPHRVNEDTTYMGPTAWQTWIVTGGTISRFALNTDRHPRYRSVKETESGALHGPMLNKYVGGVLQGFGRQYFDVLVTTEGVLLAALDNYEGLGRYEISKALNPTAGFSGYRYMYDGQAIEIMTSPCCPEGVVRLAKGRGNIKRYKPPNVPGTGRKAGFSQEIEFLGPWLGYNGIFVPLTDTSTGLPTQHKAAPYVDLHEFCPDFFPVVEINGLSESIYTG